MVVILVVLKSDVCRIIILRNAGVQDKNLAGIMPAMKGDRRPVFEYPEIMRDEYY